LVAAKARGSARHPDAAQPVPRVHPVALARLGIAEDGAPQAGGRVELTRREERDTLEPPRFDAEAAGGDAPGPRLPQGGEREGVPPRPDELPREEVGAGPVRPDPRQLAREAHGDR